MSDSNDKIRWGILGLGKIARKFATDLLLFDNVERVAVGSRSIEKAKDFAETYGFNKYYGSYLELIQDETIDIVYVATPHMLHKELTVLTLDNKKAVLCEKPFAMNSSQVAQMIQASKRNQRFLMEALWTRFIPSIKKIKELIDAEKIGDVNYINADFAFQADPGIRRIYDMELGGGSLLDIGIYPVFLSYLLLGVPDNIQASAEFYDTGADKQLSMIFSYKTAQAILYSSFLTNSKRIAKISGTKGEIFIDAPWNDSESFSLQVNDHKEEFEEPKFGSGFTYQIEACNTSLYQNELENPLWTHQNSIELMELLDRIRKIIGLTYREDLDEVTL